jgi:hypothetical protein
MRGLMRRELSTTLGRVLAVAALLRRSPRARGPA